MRVIASLCAVAVTAGPVRAEPATALDGQARSYEQAPEPESVRGGSILAGLGTGVGWLFRIVLSPFRGALYVEAHWHTFTKIRRLFVNDAGTLGVYPTLQYTTDYGLSYGAQAFGKNFFDKGDEIELLALTGGAIRKELQLKLELPHLGGTPLYIQARARYDDNDDLYFAGLGNQMSPVTRFSERRFLALLSTGVELGSPGLLFRIGASAIYNHRRFGAAGGDATDPSIETAYDTSMIDGFDGGVQTLELSGDAALDWRDSLGDTGAGGVLRAFGGATSVIDQQHYGHYGGELAYFLAPFWPHRVIVARAALEGVTGNATDIPFTELPRLGGAGLLRGYHADQFRDRLAAIGTVEYHYPIHEQLSGHLFVEAGKVAGTYTELRGGSDWHVGYGGGLSVHTRTSVVVRFDVAYGDGLYFYFSTDVLDAFRKREREL